MYLREFLGEISLAPVAKAARAKRSFLILFWILVLILSLVITSFQLADLLAKLQSGNKIAVPRILTGKELKFPAVTFCNLNPYKNSSVASLDIFTVLKDVSDTVANASRIKREIKAATPADAANRSEIAFKPKPVKRQLGCAPSAVDTTQMYHVQNYRTGYHMDFTTSAGFLNENSPLYYPDLSQMWIFHPESSQTSPQYFYIVHNKTRKALMRLENNQLVLAHLLCNATEQLFRVEFNSSDCIDTRRKIAIGNMFFTANSDIESDAVVLIPYQDPSLNNVTRQDWVLLASGVLPTDFIFDCSVSQCAPDPNKFYKIINNQTQLTFRSISTAVYAHIDLYAYQDLPLQQFSFQILTNPTRYLVLNRGSNLFMTWNSTRGIIQDFNKNDSETFQIINDNEMCMFKSYSTTSTFSAYYITPANFKLSSTNVQTLYPGYLDINSTSHNPLSQRYSIVEIGQCAPDPNKFYKIINNQTQLAFEVRYQSTASGENIELYPYLDATNQHWSFQKLYNPIRYLVVNRGSNLFMTWKSTRGIFQDVNKNDSETFQLISDNGMCMFKSYSTTSNYNSYYITPANFQLASQVLQTLYPDYLDISVPSPNPLSQRYSIVEIEYQSTTSAESTSMTTTKSSIETTIAKEINILNLNIDQLSSEDIIQLLKLKQNSDGTSQTSSSQALLPYLMSKLSETQRMSLGFQTSDVIQYCSFNGRKCDYGDIIQWNDMVSGNCFTFNHKTSPKQRVAIHAGPQYGLKILFNVMSKEYLPMTMSSGVKIFIHDPNATIFPDVEGDVVSAYFAAEFSLLYQEIIRETADCITVSHSYNNFYSGDYSYESCIRTCYQRRIIEVCGCADPDLAIQNVVPQTQRFCRATEISCVQNIYDTNTAGNFNCSCPLPCKEKLFEKTKTLSKLRLDFGNENKSLINSNSEFVAVEVFYRSLSYIMLEDNYEYTIVSFLANLGGILGVNLGATFITLFELTLLFFLFVSRFIGTL